MVKFSAPPADNYIINYKFTFFKGVLKKIFYAFFDFINNRPYLFCRFDRKAPLNQAFAHHNRNMVAVCKDVVDKVAVACTDRADRVVAVCVVLAGIDCFADDNHWVGISAFYFERLPSCFYRTCHHI